MQNISIRILNKAENLSRFLMSTLQHSTDQEDGRSLNDVVRDMWFSWVAVIQQEGKHVCFRAGDVLSRELNQLPSSDELLSKATSRPQLTTLMTSCFVRRFSSPISVQSFMKPLIQ